MKTGDKLRIVGLLPFNKQHLYQKTGMLIQVDRTMAYPVSMLVDEKEEHFTLEDVKPEKNSHK